ncbi:MAG: recombination mediator RecR [Candidatus Margulisiibacteriota bacterium]|nr:recombination mediator RecR [Candidatus Margulisiibacteriota bacterium]
MEAVLLNDSPIGHHSSDKSFPLNELIDHFSVFKGIGKKSAQRLALESILLAPEKVQRFADSLVYARQNIRFCVDCYYLTWGTKCHVCLDEARNKQQLCVVSEPKDVLAIDQSRSYKGLFHVLGGVISPLDGVYPEMLRCKELKTRIIENNVNEVILALNPTVEGDATVLYLQQFLEDTGVSIFKLAQGIPVGSDVAYLDEVTIDKAFEGKRLL